MATDTPEAISELVDTLLKPRNWTGLAGYGGAYTWQADGLLVDLRVDDDDIATYTVLLLHDD
jgi:hypothetical protein